VQESDLDPSPLPGSDPAVNAVCDAIYHALRLILLRLHAYLIGYRNAILGKQNHPVRPLLLQGIVELFQYYLFVKKLEDHLNNLVEGLKRSGVDVYMRFNRLGETAEELIALLAYAPSADDQKKKSLGGEVLLRIAER
jgi:mediator of RNA polymerase II transcription subunit 17